MLSFLSSRKSIVVGILLLGLSACVAPYEGNFVTDAVLLVVDGTVTDLPEKQVVKIARAQLFNGIPATIPVEGARAEILVNGQTLIALREGTVKGQYEAPDDFRGKVGSSYQLRFQIGSQSYESSVEVMPGVPPIGKVYDRFDAAGVVNIEKTRALPANLIYIDFQDRADARNFYRWNWTLWEQQTWCATCQQGIYNLSANALSGSCQTTRSLLPSNLYDYNCLGSCWEIIRNLDVNLFDDAYSKGRPVVGRLVATIPYYQNLGALIEIRQSSLSREAYRYFKLLQDQSQNTGGLADTPPAPLLGNVRNRTDEQDKVTGYFGASSVASVRYWLDRQNVSGLPINLFVGLNNRPANPEPPSALRPPTAVCVPGEGRTPFKPVGWPK
ncbi:MAG: DUF4249 domain-containing protein [Cytophagaceae bacterium]|nr:DUF4249 domain-containing protein [Cytophagaceae bacterium]